MKYDEITIGQEYQYLGQFVTVTELWPDKQTAIIETRYSDYAQINITELTPKPPVP